MSALLKSSAKISNPYFKDLKLYHFRNCDPHPSNEKCICIPSIYKRTKKGRMLFAEAMATYNEALNIRTMVFASLHSLAARVLAAFVEAGAIKKNLNKFKNLNRNLQATHLQSFATIVDAAEPVPQNIELSLLQYRTMMSTFEKMIEMAAKEPGYQPGNSILQVAALLDYHANLRAANLHVAQTHSDLLSFRARKGSTLYLRNNLLSVQAG